MGCDNTIKSSFSEYGHVAYQINGNEAYINMPANILPLLTLSATGVGSIFFLNVVMLHIKLKKMKHRTPCKQIFLPFTHHGVKRSFSESRHVVYQIKGKEV